MLFQLMIETGWQKLRKGANLLREFGLGQKF